MKKSKFFMIIMAIILVCSLAFVLTACGGDEDEGADAGTKPPKPCKHTFEQTFDDNNHWLKCSKCDEIKEVVAHSFKDDFHDNKHYKACTGCAYTKEDEKHVKEWQVENDLHWEKCTKCNFVSAKETHHFDANGKCKCGMELNDHTHTEAESITFDGLSHWHQCTGCNQLADSKIDHIMVNGKCSACGYYEGSSHLIYTNNIITGVDIEAILEEFENNKGEGETELAPLNIVVANAYGKFVIDTVEGGAFANRDKVKIASVTLPETIKVIRGSAFSNRAELETIIFKGTMEQWKNINKMYNWDNGTSDTLKIVCKDGEIAKDGTETPYEPTEPEPEPEQPSGLSEPVLPPEDENKDNNEEVKNNN